MTQDRKDLKIQALLEKVSSLTTNYENQVADLRVEVTLLTDALQLIQSQLPQDEAQESDTDVSEEDTDATDDTD